MWESIPGPLIKSCTKFVSFAKAFKQIDISNTGMEFVQLFGKMGSQQQSEPPSIKNSFCIEQAIVLTSAFVSEVVFIRKLLPPSAFQRIPIGETNIHALSTPSSRMSEATHQGIYTWIKVNLRNALNSMKKVKLSVIVALRNELQGPKEILEAFEIVVNFVEQAENDEIMDIKKSVRCMVRSLHVFVCTLPPLQNGSEMILDVASPAEENGETADILSHDLDDVSLGEKMDKKAESERSILRSLAEMERIVLRNTVTPFLSIQYTYCYPRAKTS